MINLRKISLFKYALPTGLAVLSNQVVVGLGKFSKVGNLGVLEIIVPVGVFIGYFAILKKLKQSFKDKRQSNQFPPSINYDMHYNNLNSNQSNSAYELEHDTEFYVQEVGVKKEKFVNGEKITEYEFRRRSSTW